MQQLRKRAERDALVEDVLEFGVSARDSVANDNQVGTRLEITRVEGLRHWNAQFRQEI